MDGIRDDGDGVGEQASKYFPSDEDKGNEYNKNKALIRASVIFLRWWLIQFLHIPGH